VAWVRPRDIFDFFFACTTSCTAGHFPLTKLTLGQLPN